VSEEGFGWMFAGILIKLQGQQVELTTFSGKVILGEVIDANGDVCRIYQDDGLLAIVDTNRIEAVGMTLDGAIALKERLPARITHSATFPGKPVRK